MSVFKKETTEFVLSKATDRLTADIRNLNEKKESAISLFRETATSLEEINRGLKESVETFERLAAFIEEQKSGAEKTISDNEKVRAKIFEIIGADE